MVRMLVRTYTLRAPSSCSQLLVLVDRTPASTAVMFMMTQLLAHRSAIGPRCPRGICRLGATRHTHTCDG